ncbi:TlpA disulfide reductase family protein [Sphingobacterium mizutaii]|uniref:TlpA disulfide reductase family protein n=1 Tax=Sphingobacterium mizutaii TaxID=1010 RepID=UPI0028A8A648|nr:TlpA disulfide reductase family protein [Sphingobacterium mizutaii]
MRFLSTIFLFVSIFFQSLSAQEITLKGTISNLGDSIKYIHLSSFNGFQVHKLDNNTFEFKIPGELPQDKVNHAFIVLSKNEYKDSDSLVAALNERKELHMGKDPIRFIVDAQNMDIEVDAKEKIASVEGSTLNKQNLELNAAKTQTMKSWQEGKLSYDDMVEQTFSESLKVLQNYPNSLLTMEFLNNTYKDPFMETALKNLNPQNIYAAQTLIAKIKEQNLPKEKVDELLDNYKKLYKSTEELAEIPFPAIKLTSLKDDTLSIKNLYNQADYIVMDIWATWCVPCLQQHPEYERIAGISKKNVKFIGLSIDEKQTNWKNHLNEHPKKYENYWLEKAEVKELHDSLGIQSYPTYLIINTKTGNLVQIKFPIERMEEFLAALE